MENNFRRIGDLYSVGIAFISLYTDEAKQGLYLSYRTNEMSNSHPVYLISSVNATDIFNFMGKKQTLRKTMKQSTGLFVRFFDNDNSWKTKTIDIKDLSTLMPKDRKFAPRYCDDKHTIIYYLNKYFINK